MSYEFTITFKEIERKNLDDYLLKFMEFNRKNVMKILSDNAFYIPSVRLNITDPDIPDYYKSGWREADRYWVQNLLTTRFLYWNEKSLLGIVGEAEREFDPDVSEIYFQDHTDQDYAFCHWSGIKMFESIANECRNASMEEIRLVYPHLLSPGEENGEDIDKFRRSMAYDRIFSELGLKSWEYEVSGKFQQFSMNALTSSRDIFNAHLMLESVRRKKIEELKEK